MKKKAVIWLIIVCFSKSYSQCEDDQCFQHFENLVEDEKDRIQQIFDGILEKYGDIEEDLRNLLNKLNNTINKADLNLNKLENDNNHIININNKSNSTLSDLLQQIKVIENEMKNISIRNWTEELADANKTANLNITIPTTLNDVKAIESDMDKWKTFLEKFDVNNYAKDILNIPYSVSDDLILLETLLDEETNINCFDKFHEDLKLLFAQLTSLLNIERFKEEIANIKKKSDENKKDADEILTMTQHFLQKEKEFNDTLKLVNETLTLAQEIDALKKTIDELQKTKENMLNDKIQEIQKAHDADLKKLYKKYDLDKFEILLDELEDVNKQIQELSNGEHNSIDLLEQDIQKYIDDIDYYTCVLEDCRYRKPAEAANTFHCTQKTG